MDNGRVLVTLVYSTRHPRFGHSAGGQAGRRAGGQAGDRRLEMELSRMLVLVLMLVRVPWPRVGAVHCLVRPSPTGAKR